MVKENCVYVGSKSFLHNICDYQFKKIKINQKLHSETQSTVYSLAKCIGKGKEIHIKVKLSRYRPGVTRRFPES